MYQLQTSGRVGLYCATGISARKITTKNIKLHKFIIKVDYGVSYLLFACNCMLVQSIVPETQVLAKIALLQ